MIRRCDIRNMVFICRLNQYFLNVRVVITDLNEIIIYLYREILLCFLKREYVTQTKLYRINPKNGQFQLIDGQLYLGVKVMSHIDDQNVIANNMWSKIFFEVYTILIYVLDISYFYKQQRLKYKKRYYMVGIILSKLSTLKPENYFSLEY
ncbi:Dimer Tnp hAT domain-containing protein [Aphis craccivora]|uniref:Dimer Tnp hAT domain-containing protein n=1 Tax=Aphis craccivora TaxID=307492 RepID=A0A6G0YJ37_APHCR|nr:Dimer Tnp hAT domain-containing protein [Aphis craccivora]